jgi:hypothetical protein
MAGNGTLTADRGVVFRHDDRREYGGRAYIVRNNGGSVVIEAEGDAGIDTVCQLAIT